MNILILDTEPRWRKHWQQQGVPTAETIVEALAALPASKIDVIVLDYLLIHHAPPLAAATGAKIAVAAGQPYTLDIMPELYLFLAVVTQARMDARSKCSRVKWEARSFLRALDLPVNGPATIRITRAKRLAIRDET